MSEAVGASEETAKVELSTRDNDWYHEFASRLIRENFLLTALEFHAELAEAGKELSKLREFFSNPSDFEQASNRPEISVDLPRSSSQATLDSLDFARYSEDGERSCDEKVAVLEFELRKAKETISALRTNLTFVTESDDRNLNEETAIDNKFHQHAVEIRPYEQRALNFLINEYLLRHGYKLTSITFADENESQDFEDWDDVGLNVSRPRELLHLYREGLKITKAVDAQYCDAECQVSLVDESGPTSRIKVLEAELNKFKEDISILTEEKENILKRLAARDAEQTDSRSLHSATPEVDCFELVECKSRGSSETKSLQSNGDWTKISDNDRENQAICQPDIIDQEAISMALNETLDDQLEQIVEKSDEPVDAFPMDVTIPREIPEAFKRQALKSCDITFPASNDDSYSDLTKDGDIRELTLDKLVDILSTHLQKIIPNIILNKREEVIPLLVLTICLSPESNSRDHLLTILFNLKKRPQEVERCQILKALMTIAKSLGPAITEGEVLPQCWEQIGHKYVERRLLVAESCFLLTPFVSETMRHSLVLSMIQQLVQDREESIRHVSVSCLALLVTLIDAPDKFAQLCDMTLDLLLDSSPVVSQQCLNVLLPTIAQWSFHLKRLESDLFERIIHRITANPSPILLQCLQSLLPFLIMFVADSDTVKSQLNENHPKAMKRQEFATLCKDLYDPLTFYSGSVGVAVATFDFITTDLEVTCDWPELDWVMTSLIPSLTKVAEEHWSEELVIQHIALFLRHLCAGLGSNVTQNLVKPELSRKLEVCSAGLLTNEVVHLEMIPLYAVGILSLNAKVDAGREELEATLFKFICALPLCGASLQPLNITFSCLSRINSLCGVLMDTLWSGVVYNRPVIRSATAQLLQAVVPNIPDQLISARVVPALVTLSSDPETPVRLSVIPALGMLVGSSEKQTRDKVAMTFQSVLQEAMASANHSIIIQSMKTLVECYEKFDPPFRIEVILPQLAAISALCESSKNSELAKALIEVFSTITFSQDQLPPEAFTSCILPSLRSLESLCEQIDAGQAERIQSVLRHAERLAPENTEGRSRPVPEQSPLSPGVEEVKNRVVKIFSSRPQSLQNVSGIFKKKL